jgi:ATP-dependent Clp endopeptidase proteolytic subunit ClpP
MTKPEIIIRSFSGDAVDEYLEKLENITNEIPSSQPILLIIDSPGGRVEGLACLYEALQAIHNPIATYTRSQAMSAGAILLSAAGTPGLRFASPNSVIMLHEMQTGVGGNMKEIRSRVDYIEDLNEKWMKILAVSMGLKNTNEFRQLLVDNCEDGMDLYLTAEEAKELGVVDCVSYLTLSCAVSWELSHDPVSRIERERKLIKKEMKRRSKNATDE